LSAGEQLFEALPNAQVKAGIDSGPYFENTVESDVTTFPGPDRYAGGSTGGAVSRLNGTSTEITGMSMFVPNL